MTAAAFPARPPVSGRDQERLTIILKKVKMEKWSRDFKSKAGKKWLLSLLLVLIYKFGYPQDGNAGLNAANTQVRGYFDTGTTLMYAVCALVALIGAVKVYSKWSNGDPDTGKVVAAWVGGCIFLVVVATVVKAFFGL
jgi:Domain of unknown function (DUF4134)